jgi:hypothetical protein
MTIFCSVEICATQCFMPNPYTRPAFIQNMWLFVTSGFKAKPKTHSVCDLEQVFTHAIQKVNKECQCHKYMNLLHRLLSSKD